MSEIQQMMKERMTDKEAKDVAKLLTALATALGEDAKTVTNGIRDGMDNLIYNATKIREGLGNE